MIVGYKTNIDSETESNNETGYLVWHIEGGLGKNIAATSILPSIKTKYPNRKVIIVASYPEIFLNNPYVYRVYRIGMTSYFYDDYIKDKDTIVFKHEPYFETGHILKKKHIINSWCDIFEIEYTNQKPALYFNMVQKMVATLWSRQKPIMILQTNGGSLQDNRLGYSWTRDMPMDIAISIVNQFKNDYHILQICKETSPIIQGAEQVTRSMSNMEFLSMLMMSEKRVLIDSSLQHAAAAFGLSSTVLWIGTSPNNFGYDIHNNIKAKEPRGNIKMIDSYLFDYSFDGVLHECPYGSVDEMFDINPILNSI